MLPFARLNQRGQLLVRNVTQLFGGLLALRPLRHGQSEIRPAKRHRLGEGKATEEHDELDRTTTLTLGEVVP